MILSFTLITFAMFAIYVESYRLRLSMRDLINTITSTYGSSNAIYRNPKKPQTWMRSNTIQSYK